MFFFSIILLAVSEPDLNWRVSILSSEMKAQKDRSIDDSSLLCEYFTERLYLCPLQVNENKLEYTKITKREESFGDNDWLNVVSENTKPQLDPARYVQQSIPGTSTVYWASGLMDGLDGAGWLHPKQLEAIAGGPILVAQPLPGTFFFWLKSANSAHKKMAVGIKELYTSSNEPLSPLIYHWDGDNWLVWGEAVQK